MLRPHRGLAVGETASFDLRKIRDEQLPDANGDLLPRTVTSGQFRWHWFPAPGTPQMIGRAAVSSPSRGISISYSCQANCYGFGPEYRIDGNTTVLMSGYETMSTKIRWYGSSGGYYEYNTTMSGGQMDNTSIASLDPVSSGWLNVNGLGVGDTYWSWIYSFEYDYDNGFDCERRYEERTDTQPAQVTPRIESISPARGPVDSTVGISIIGSGFGSGSAVSVGGTGVTGSIQSSSSTSLSVTLTIAPNATPGNHGVTVTKSGKTSNSMDFFVQVPTSLRRDSISALQDQQGGCGVTRSLQYTLLDQEEAPIDTNGIISEGASSYSGPADAQPQETSLSMIHGGFPDTVGYAYSPSCPPPFTATFTQSFTVALATQGYAWALSSQNAISMGQTSSGSKFVDLTFTP